MKKSKKRALVPAEVATNFTRGLVAAGLLAALQDRWHGGDRPSGRTVARLALQGGAALAAGVATAESLRRGDGWRAVFALAGGAAAIVATEALLAPNPSHPLKETDIG